MGYTGAVGTMLMDEMAGICGRAEERFTGIRTDIGKLETELLKAQDWSACHDLVSFSLQILKVINELHDLTTISLILSYLSHFLSFHYLIKGTDDIIFRTYTRPR